MDIHFAIPRRLLKEQEDEVLILKFKLLTISAQVNLETFSKIGCGNHKHSLGVELVFPRNLPAITTSLTQFTYSTNYHYTQYIPRTPIDYMALMVHD